MARNLDVFLPDWVLIRPIGSKTVGRNHVFSCWDQVLEHCLKRHRIPIAFAGLSVLISVLPYDDPSFFGDGIQQDSFNLLKNCFENITVLFEIVNKAATEPCLGDF
jgi:hypothetical protein